MTERGKRRLFKLTALVGGLIIGLFVAEIVLRIAGYSQPEFYRPSTTLGYELIPGMSGWYSKEGRSWVEINNDGFRDMPHAVEKPGDVFRVAVVGDSYVEALQVNEDERFTRYLRDDLRSCPAVTGKRVEVLSFGVSGYGTAQELLMAREKVWRYQPDLVLLLITTNNDITDNLRAFKRTPIPYFVREGDGLGLDETFREDSSFKARISTFGSLGLWFKNHLRTVQGIGALATAIKYKWRAWRAGQQGPMHLPDQDSAALPVGDVGIDIQIYRPPADERWTEAWETTERIVKLFNIEAREHDARFAVVTGSNGVQVMPQTPGREAYARSLSVPDLLYPDRRIAAFCGANGIGSVTLVEDLALYAEQNNVYLHGFGADIGNGHWNKAGHRAAGEILTRRLCQILSTNESP